MTEAQGRILVVDDNRLNRQKISMILEQQGHTVERAEGGHQALVMLDAGPFDVVLLDILMPEMDGYEVLERIKSTSTLRDIPVIVISALDEIDSAVRCIEMGAEDYLAKPVNPILLRARLNASLQRKRLRDLERAYLQQEVMLRQSEKLATLGKLSAGLAHELNNPAAAAQRGAAQLQTVFSRLQLSHLRLCEANLTSAQVETLLRFEELARTRAKAPIYANVLDRSDQETEMEAWLSEQGVENAWEVAPTLVEIGLPRDELTTFSKTLSAAQLSSALEWLTSSFQVSNLREEISHGAGRIAEIVRALKSYSYMDQAPFQNVDIHESLENTLIVLRSKLRDGVTVVRDYAEDLPQIQAFGSELNQVWTNLIDNAIDAMNGAGQITMRTRHDDQSVVVVIEDNGPGIPQAIQANVFDPFFTTKQPGKGTGLGLNISHNIVVQRHNGRIDVHSEPGLTRFEVRLPLHLETRGE